VKILAIETTERIATLALAEGEDVVAEQRLDGPQRSAQSVAPGIARIIERTGWTPDDVDLVAVTVGPGSFTGLRVGVTTAKAFAYSVGAEVLGLDTLETIADGLPANESRVAVAIDAQRGQVAAATFTRAEDGFFKPDGPTRLLDTDVWLAELPRDIAVAGPILKKPAVRIPETVRVVDAEFWSPMAAGVARLAARHYAAGRRDDLWKLAPVYSRRPAAEEKRDQQEQGGRPPSA
jgi:tRNA threonylcarbamoyladenosine biosynthesis protein TsaB